MDPNHKIELEKLATLIKKTDDLLKKAGSGSEMTDFLKIIHGPGWTTPAEMRMSGLLVETLQTQLANIISLKSQIINAAKLVGREVPA